MFTRFLAIASALLVCGTAGDPLDAAGPATDDAAIVHVLNRITYGPRSGDVDRVRAIGIQKFIEQQLSPDRIDDAALDARLQRLETLTLDAQTIQRDYEAPAMLERRERQKQNPGADADPQDPAMRRG